MSDDTRDIAIETRAAVKHLSEKVEDIDLKLDALIKRSNEQDGMFRAGRWAVAGIGAIGGGAMTFLLKFLPLSTTLPK